MCQLYFILGSSYRKWRRMALFTSQTNMAEWENARDPRSAPSTGGKLFLVCKISKVALKPCGDIIYLYEHLLNSISTEETWARYKL